MGLVQCFDVIVFLILFCFLVIIWGSVPIFLGKPISVRQNGLPSFDDFPGVCVCVCGGGARVVYMSEAAHSYNMSGLYVILVLTALVSSERSDKPVHMRSICLASMKNRPTVHFLPHLRFHIYIAVRLFKSI